MAKWYDKILLLEGQELRGNRIFEKIAGWETYTPKIPEDIREVENWDKPIKKQKFTRTVHPVYMDPRNWEYAKEDRKREFPIWTKQQRAYTQAEKDKIFITGVWVLIKGYLFWIHGFHYFALNYWHIEAETEDGYKEFRHRDAQRWLVWKDIEESDDEFGMVYPKHRRDGASIDGWIMMYLYAQMKPGAKCGHTNKNEDDAEDAFKTMGIDPMLKVPRWLQPQHNAKPSSTEVVFTSYTTGTRNKHQITESATTSLNSRMYYRATKVDPWEGKKMAFIFADETGILGSLNLSAFVSKQVECLAQGSGTIKVGNIYMPSTSGTDEKASEQFRELLKMCMPETWDSVQRRTPLGLRTYFDRASHGLEGYIDEYGFSIEYDPTPDQLVFLKKKYPNRQRWIGARQHLIEQLQSFAKHGFWDKYYETKAKFPLTIDDPFTKVSDAQQFNTQKLMDLQFYIRANNFLHKNLVQRGDLFWVDGHTRRVVGWAKNPRGKFEISRFFGTPDQHNRVRFEGEKAYPMNAEMGCISLDPYQKGVTVVKKTGSKGAAHGILFFDVGTQESQYLPGGAINEDYYPTPALFLKYKARPTSMDEFYEDILMACHFFSMRLAFEANVYAIHEYFIKRGYEKFVYKTYEFKDGVVDKITDSDYATYGYRVPSQEDKLFADIQVVSRFIEGTDIVYQGWDYDITKDMRRIPFEETLEDLLKFENDQKVRTQCDLTMSLIPGFKINALRMKKAYYKTASRKIESEASFAKQLSDMRDSLV